MRTEEKASELARAEIGKSINTEYRQVYFYSNLESVAMKMAEWQRQRTIDLAVEWLTLNFEEDGKSLRTVYKTKGELLSEFVNDMSR